MVDASFEFRNPNDLSKLNPLLAPLHLPDFKSKWTSDEIAYPEELLDKDLMLKNFKKQIDDEKNVNVEVPSILKNTNHKKTVLNRMVSIKILN